MASPAKHAHTNKNLLDVVDARNNSLDKSK
jgi:hypothetical protein